MGAQASSAQAKAVARNHGAGGTGGPGAGGVGTRALGVGRPVVQDRLDPAPGLFLLVAAHEQVEPAVDRVEQQALVGAHPLAERKRLSKSRSS